MDPGGDWTRDLSILSHPLYHLSYRASVNTMLIGWQKRLVNIGLGVPAKQTDLCLYLAIRNGIIKKCRLFLTPIPPVTLLCSKLYILESKKHPPFSLCDVINDDCFLNQFLPSSLTSRGNRHVSFSASRRWTFLIWLSSATTQDCAMYVGSTLSCRTFFIRPATFNVISYAVYTLR